MKHGSLFSGIGGFDLAAQWMGWDNVFHCEWNEFGQKVLKYYWPDAELFTDITKSDFTKYANRIDILSGGFPCQPYSTAGKRLGKEDERHLWPEMLRAIREIKPRWVVGENVSGLISWNGGLVFDEVQADLEAEGYEVQAFVLPACAVNAPHRRDRVWFVAYRESYGQNRSKRINGWKECKQNNWDRVRPSFDTNGKGRFAADTKCTGLEGGVRPQRTERFKSGCKENDGAAAYTSSSRRQNRLHGGGEDGQRETDKPGDGREEQPTNWENFPTQSPLCSGDDGLPTELDGITFSKWRNESIKGYGNAVVPQVVLQIFKAIEAYEHTKANG